MKQISLDHCKKWLSVHLKMIGANILIAAILSLSLYATIHSAKKPESEHHSTPLIVQLKSIQSRLSTIEQVVSHTDAPNLEPIKQQLTLLSERINTLQTIKPEQL